MARVVILLAMLLSGTAASQLPEFAQQYRQRLGGAIDALEEVLSDFARDADQYGLTIAEAIDRQKASTDAFIRARGDSMAAADARLGRLKEHRSGLQDAGAGKRLVLFLREFDAKLAEATARDFEPAVPVTIEGLASAGVGAAGGYGLMRLALALVRVKRRRPKDA